MNRLAWIDATARAVEQSGFKVTQTSTPEDADVVVRFRVKGRTDLRPAVVIARDEIERWDGDMDELVQLKVKAAFRLLSTSKPRRRA